MMSATFGIISLPLGEGVIFRRKMTDEGFEINLRLPLRAFPRSAKLCLQKCTLANTKKGGNTSQPLIVG